MEWEKKKKRKKEGGMKSKERKRERMAIQVNKMPRFNKKSIAVARQLSWGYPKENELGVRVSKVEGIY